VYPPGGDGGGYPQPQGPPPGYAYPPVPVPFNPEGQYHPQQHHPIMNQPGAGQGGKALNTTSYTLPHTTHIVNSF